MKDMMTKQEAIDKARILKSLIELTKVEKILSTFIVAFKEKTIHKNNRYYLHGNFNLGGTVSGRLSSSKPNLQQIPSTGSIYAKPIKQCFEADSDWIMCGADFSSLEDRIDALLTKDTNKLKVYTDGYDGHSLRAYYYFKEHMSDIDPNSVDSINSIQTKYKKYRQDSKAPTFALTYGGTYHTLMKNCGFDEATAKSIEANYHEMYKESDEYKSKRLKDAASKGYAEVAFGLRVRTPILKQVLWDNKATPYEAMAEGRTVGNAMGQSYGLLNNRAANEFMNRVWDSEYKYDIQPVSLIHDAAYFICKRDPEVIKFLNENLIECMEWQKAPEIAHDKVKLGAELELFHTWAKADSIPNHASIEDIQAILMADEGEAK